MRLIGLTGGVFNFVGGLGGITVPLVIGYLAQDYGFGPTMIYIAAVALIGVLSCIRLVGEVKRSAEPEASQNNLRTLKRHQSK